MALAVIFTFVAALGFGTSSILTRIGTQRISGPTATLFSVGTSVPVALVPALVLHWSDMLDQPWEAYAWFALMAAMAYPFARVLINIAIKRVGSSRTAPFSSIQPIFVFVLGTAILGERPELLVVLGTPVIVGGLVLVVVSRIANSNADRAAGSNTLGYLLAAAGAATFAGRDVIGRHVVSGVAPPLVTAAYALSMGSIMLLTLNFRDAAKSIREVPARYIGVCALAGLCQGTALVLQFQALSRADVTIVSPILGTSSLFVLVLAHIFLQRLESVNLILVVGASLSVTGVTLVVVGSQV